MGRDGFVFYASWLEAIKNLPREIQGEVLTAIIEYGLYGETTETPKPITSAMLAMVKPQIDVNNKRYENGTKGGRPPKSETKPKPNDNQTETKPKPNDNQTETKPEPNDNQTETKPEPKEKEKDKDKDNIISLTDNNIIQKENTSNEVSKKDELSFHPDKVDYVALMDFFNKTFNGKLPTIKTMTDARKKAIKARIAQYGKQAVFDVMKKVYQSTFLLGGNDRNWKCDFDWIFKQEHFTKILEGRYDNGTSAGQRNTTDEKRESARNLKEMSATILMQSLSENDK